MPNQGVSFLPSGAILIAGFLLLVVTGIYCWLAWSRAGYRKATGALELLRFVLASLILITLCQPEWLELQPAALRPTIAVLWDQSGSMQTRDVVDSGIGGAPKTRAASIKPLLSQDVWKQDANESEPEVDVVFEPFQTPGQTSRNRVLWLEN